MKSQKIEIYIATIFGAFLLVLADLCTNIDAATTLKIGFIIKKYIISGTSVGTGVIGLILVLLISTIFCWIFHPKDRVAAFTRGLSVFAVLNVVAPYSIVEDVNVNRQNIQSNAGMIERQLKGELFPFINSAYAETGSEGPECKSGVLESNAYLLSEEHISSCKPHYSGFLGLGSLFNNTIEYCFFNHVLPRNERVRYIQSWETTMRKYRYTQIEYEYNGKICIGWVSDGRKSIRSVIKD